MHGLRVLRRRELGGRASLSRAAAAAWARRRRAAPRSSALPAPAREVSPVGPHRQAREGRPARARGSRILFQVIPFETIAPPRRPRGGTGAGRGGRLRLAARQAASPDPNQAEPRLPFARTSRRAGGPAARRCPVRAPVAPIRSRSQAALRRLDRLGGFVLFSGFSPVLGGELVLDRGAALSYGAGLA